MLIWCSCFCRLELIIWEFILIMILFNIFGLILVFIFIFFVLVIDLICLWIVFFWFLFNFIVEVIFVKIVWLSLCNSVKYCFFICFRKVIWFLLISSIKKLCIKGLICFFSMCFIIVFLFFCLIIGFFINCLNFGDLFRILIRFCIFLVNLLVKFFDWVKDIRVVV